MTAETLNRLAEGAYVYACKTIDDGGEVTPMLTFENADKQLTVMAIPQMGEPNLKDAAVMAMRAKMRKARATDYVLVMEAWVSWVARGEEPLVRPSQDPNRQDMLAIMGGDKTGLALGWFAKIVTRSRGKRQLGPLELQNHGKSKGRFASLLYDKHAN